MKPVWFAATFGAALLFSASAVEVNAMGGGGCHLPRRNLYAALRFATASGP
jgi:hypothetical protein